MVDQADTRQPKRRKVDVVKGSECPYLGSITRHILDFDFEKICSVSLSNRHVYCCLVCGKFYDGRGRHTHAYVHSLENEHHLFMNLQSGKVYCLPDGYEVDDASLDDIRYYLDPRYTEEQVEAITASTTYARSLDGTDYIPGIVGLNNLKRSDFFNVTIQALCAVAPLRKYLLRLDLSHVQSPDRVLYTSGELFRKIMNPRNFKGIVSPHELIQAITIASEKKFRIGEVGDPIKLLAWVLDRIRRKGPTDDGKNVIEHCFQGKLLVSTTKLDANGVELEHKEDEITSLYFPLKVPPSPIFKDSLDRNMIPQVPLFELLQQYDGETVETTKGGLKRFTILKLPRYLILWVQRFNPNNFFVEKNPTVVTLPTKNLDLHDYVHPSVQEDNPVTKYDLIANICHTGKPMDGQYKCHILRQSTKQFYEIEDLRVSEVLPQVVALSESYINIYQRHDISLQGEDVAPEDLAEDQSHNVVLGPRRM